MSAVATLAAIRAPLRARAVKRPATTRRAFTTRATATESGSKSDEIVGMPVVLIDNRSDPLATVVSVQFSDVLGQLLDTVESLKALGLNVSRAEVTQDENPNKFYVTDAATSEKVVKSEQIENIRMAVINNMIAYHPESKQYFEGASASFGSFDVDANPLGARPPSKVKTKLPSRRWVARGRSSPWRRRIGPVSSSTSFAL